MIQEGIVSRLVADATIKGLCASRIYPVVLPKSPTFPAITYHDISLVTDPTTEGSGLCALRIRFNCWADSYARAKKVQLAVESLFDGFVGVLPDGTEVSSLLEMVQDLYEPDTQLYNALIEISFS